MRGTRRALQAATRLVDAWRGRDAAALAATLHPHAVLTAEGLDAVTEPVRGADAVATTLLHLTAGAAPDRLTAGAGPDRLTLAEANGGPAIVLRSADAVRGVVVLEARRGVVTRLWAVFTPAKLRTWT